MKTFRLLTLACLLLTLTACKIDLSIFGTGSVKTDSGSIDCSTGTTGDCNQEYVTDMQECDAAGNCTLVTTSTTETFNALPGDNSSFGGWGELCFKDAGHEQVDLASPRRSGKRGPMWHAVIRWNRGMIGVHSGVRIYPEGIC